MNEFLTKDTLKQVESLLLSGDSTNIDLGLLLAESQEIELGPMMESVNQLCDIFLSKGLETTTEKLLRLTKLRKISIHIGDFEARTKDAIADSEVIGYVENFDLLPEDWANLLPNLAELTLGGGQIDTLPDEIGHLLNLKKLSVLDVAFKKFPPSFKNLQQLKVLKIKHAIQYCPADSPFFALPEEICQLAELEELHIESCLLSFIPEQIQQLPALRKLYINCDPEALFEHPKDYKNFSRRKDFPEALHFVPNTLSVLPCLEELTLLLPTRHFPLSEQIFQNTHLRQLQLSSRLVSQLPLHSKELRRLEGIEIFKPTLFQYIHLVFALPDTEVAPMPHHYAKSVFWRNIFFMLLIFPVGAWYFSFELLVNQLCLPPQKGYSKILRFCLALVFYPIAFIIFIMALLYWGMAYVFRSKKASNA
jgi:hypothetical protein